MTDTYYNTDNYPNNGEQDSYGHSYGGRGQYNQNGQYGRSNGQYNRNFSSRRSNGEQYEQGGSNYKSNYRYNRRYEGGDQYRSNQGSDDSLKFTIVESYGVFHTDPRSGYTKEVNLVSWNEAKPKFDIRAWSPDHKKMGKGLTFTADEFIIMNTITSALVSSKPELKARYLELLNEQLNDSTKDPNNSPVSLGASTSPSITNAAADAQEHNVSHEAAKDEQISENVPF